MIYVIHLCSAIQNYCSARENEKGLGKEECSSYVLPTWNLAGLLVYLGCVVAVSDGAPRGCVSRAGKSASLSSDALTYESAPEDCFLHRPTIRMHHKSNRHSAIISFTCVLSRI